MRNPIAVFLSILFAASLCGATARADAKGDLLVAAKNFGALKSVHATITSGNSETFSVDMVERGKIRGTSPQGFEFVRIGTTSWVKMGGAWHTYSLGSTGATQMALARGSKLQRSILTECTVADGGMSPVNGVPARKYHVVCNSGGSSTDVWVANGLPVKMVDGGTTLIWSNYNNVADIKPPM